jgi:hypothetical protein
MTLPKHEQAALIVRARIAAGTLRPGRPAPSGDLERRNSHHEDVTNAA